MNQVNDSESKEVILLPSKHSFESVGMCGGGGIVKVHSFLFSSAMIIMSLFSKPKSLTETVFEKTSLKHKYGTCSITSCEQAVNLNTSVKRLVTYTP